MIHANSTCNPCQNSTYPSGLAIADDVMQRALSIAPAHAQLASLAMRQNPEEYTSIATVDNIVQVSWFLTEPGTFAAVKQACLDNMGEIATINSAEENQAVDALCTVVQCSIDYVRDTAPGVLYWSSGDQVVYVNWHSTEPGSTETKSVILSGGWWADYRQGQLIYPGVCQRRAACTDCLPTPTSSSALSSADVHNSLAFDRTKLQVLDDGPHMFDIESNRGFTAVALVKFGGEPVAWERVFDLHNGYPGDNIILSRHDATSGLIMRILNGADWASECRIVMPGSITQGNWLEITTR